jgi:hypothetical protein
MPRPHQAIHGIGNNARHDQTDNNNRDSRDDVDGIAQQ